MLFYVKRIPCMGNQHDMVLIIYVCVEETCLRVTVYSQNLSWELL